MFMFKLKKNKEFLYGIGSMGIVLLILGMVFWKQGIYPLGDKTLIYNDMQYQYLDFFMWFRGVLHGEDSASYSFFMGQGGNTVSLVAYYLASPLNLLCYFIKEEYMAEFLTLLIVLKLMLCSMTTYIYLNRRFELKMFYSCIISVSYGLMGYNILQCSNIMWLDGVLILPLVALGIYEYTYKRKTGLYYITLFYAVFTNWYIGYMLCLFAVLYFLFELIYSGLKTRIKIKEVIKSIFGFAFVSILAVGSTSVLFLPQTLHMMNDGEAFDWSIFTPKFGFSVLEGFKDFFLEPDKLTWSEGYPPIYIGSFVLVSATVFFVSKKIEVKKKYVAAAYLGGFMLIFNFRPLNYMFTLFKIPSSHTYRYAFIFSFFMVVIAALCLQELGELNGKEVRNALLMIIGILLLLDVTKGYSIREKAYLSAVLAVITGVGLLEKVRKKQKFIFLANALILVCTMTEFYQKADMEFEGHNIYASSCSEYNKIMQESVDILKQQDNDYYRIDKTFTRQLTGGCNNEGMAFGYSSISNYSSTNNVKIAELLKKCGYTGDTTLVTYSPILAIDALMGVKYIYSDKSITEGERIQENLMDGRNLYKNPYALSVGYRAENLESDIVWEESPLRNHEILYEKILGKPVSLYVLPETLSEQTDGSSYTQWEIKVKKTGPLYVYFENGQEGMEIYVNDQYVSGNTWYNNQVEYLGTYQKDDTVMIKVMAGSGQYQKEYGITAGTLDMGVFKSAIEDIKLDQLKVKTVRKENIVLEKSSGEAETAVLTIPYEKGWNIKVNGEKIEYFKALDSFIGLNLPSGLCEIEMEYEVPGKIEGILLSISCLTVYLFFRRKRKCYQ